MREAFMMIADATRAIEVAGFLVLPVIASDKNASNASV
jgi:hypothetical protein